MTAFRMLLGAPGGLRQQHPIHRSASSPPRNSRHHHGTDAKPGKNYHQTLYQPIPRRPPTLSTPDGRCTGGIQRCPEAPPIRRLRRLRYHALVETVPGSRGSFHVVHRLDQRIPNGVRSQMIPNSNRKTCPRPGREESRVRARPHNLVERQPRSSGRERWIPCDQVPAQSRSARPGSFV